ncbi:MAG: cob(I)yrinic acid a,c-diamide adenosyltransferase [Candidatus Eiseniibacteriota bacterium]
MGAAVANDSATVGSAGSVEGRETRKGVLLVITGNGKGKTTSGFGTALRAVGHGFKVAVIQFMKGRIYGELDVLRSLPGVEVWQFGRNVFVDPKNPDPKDVALAREGMDKAWEIVRGGAHDLLILDEINVVADFGLIPVSEVLDLARARPRWMDLIATGRNAPAPLVELADTVSDVREIKHHYKKGIESRAGMEY